MKLNTLNERIANAEQKITKKQATIEKKFAWIAKKEKALPTMNENDAFWAECDIKHWKEDIDRNAKEIEELKAALEGYKAQLEGAESEERMLKEIPENLKRMHDDLIAKWDEHDKNHREWLRSKYDELGYREFIKTYHYTAYEEMHRTDEEIHKENVSFTRNLILNLIYRVRDHVGVITDWSGIETTQGTHGWPVLNGVVAGTQGKCTVESIGAGGYNIQRYHIRVLVKEWA